MYVRSILSEIGIINEQTDSFLLRRNDDDKKTIGYRRADYVIETDSGIFLLDAKYKPGWNNIVPDYVDKDIRQILLYGEVWQANIMGVIFPFKAQKEESYVHKYSVGKKTDDVSFLICGLKIPDMKDKSYSVWKQELEVQEKKLCEELNDKIRLVK